MEAVAEAVAEFQPMAVKLGIMVVREIIHLRHPVKGLMVVEEKVMVNDLLAEEEEVQNPLVQIANFPQNTPTQVMVAPEDQILIEPVKLPIMGEVEEAEQKAKAEATPVREDKVVAEKAGAKLALASKPLEEKQILEAAEAQLEVRGELELAAQEL